MSLTVKSLTVSYNPINQNNTFTSGDFISGQVVLEVAKDTQIQYLSVKIKGKATVLWSERHGKTTVVYSDKDKFYSVERFFVPEDKTHGNHPETLKDHSGQPYPSVVSPGRHVYSFTFQLPQQNFPPTFKGSHGKVLYTLETKLARSMRISTKGKTEFTYVPRPDLSIPDLMTPQYGSKDKHMKIFTSGSVSMNIHTEKMGYYLGEGLKILAEVQNSSSRTIKPKYCLYQKHSFFARGKRKLHTHDLLKEEGEPIEQGTNKNITKVLAIPPSLTVSILNCRILRVEYRLRVYLDVPYATDPEVKFPVVILPFQPVAAGYGSSSNSDFGIWNQPTGSDMYPNQFFAAPSASSFNVVRPPGQFGVPAVCGPPPGQIGALGYPGPPAMPPAYPGPPGPLAVSYRGPSVSIFPQPDVSAPPAYQDYRLYPQYPEHPEKS